MPPLDKPTIQITVLNDPSQKDEDCQAGCALDWSLPESLALARQAVKERFGQRARIEYVNLAKTAARRDALKWREEAQKKNLQMPLLLLNGQVRVSGPFNIRQLLDAIEVEIEIGV